MQQCSECVVSTDPNFSYSHSVQCRIGVVDVVRKRCICGRARAPLTQNPQKIGSRVEPYVELEPYVRRVVRPAIMFGESYEPYVPPRAHTPPPRMAHDHKRRKTASSKPRIVSLWDVVSMSDLDLDLPGAE